MLEEEIDISEAINREVVKAGADLIVMPSHGRGTLERIWFGSIADTVYRHAAVPVLLARPNTERVDFTHEVAIRKILVALDGTTLAEQILAPVVDLSLAMQAELLLVRADSHERPPQDGWKGGATSRLESLSPIPGSVREHASAYLEAVAASLLSRGAKVGTRLLPSSHPADAIVHAAAGCDLIAMQTHARTGFSRFLHGSVVEDVLNHSTLPLLVSRHHA
jgi:nucleotide-binding universal stress UspA family protein